MQDLPDTSENAITLTAGDRIAIHELMYKLHFAIDSGDAVALAALFAEDGVFVARDELQIVRKEVAGRSEIEKFTVFFADPARGDAKHYLTNLVCFPQAEDVRVVGYILKVDVATGPTPVASATDDCLVRKIGDTWYLSRFDHYIDAAYSKNHPRAD